MCYWWNKVIKYVDNLSIYTHLLIGTICFISAILSVILGSLLRSDYINNYIWTIVDYIVFIIFISTSIVLLLRTSPDAQYRRDIIKRMDYEV